MDGNDLGKALALPITAFIAGKEWRVSLPVKGIQGEFSIYLKALARRALCETLEGQPQEVVVAALKELSATFLEHDPPLVVDGKTTNRHMLKYAFGSVLCMEAMTKDLDAQVYFFWLLLKRYQQDIDIDGVTDLLSADPIGFQAACEAVLEAGKSNPRAMLAQ